MSMTEQSLWDTIDRIRETDGRYAREAYLFVVAALGFAVQGLPDERRSDPERRHLSGQELVGAVVKLGCREFGPLAATVFREWGVRSNPDVGAIVFQLVGSGQLSARPEDTMDDFRGGRDLLAALEDHLASQTR